jgi:ketosteroid isomerase-like protein
MKFYKIVGGFIVVGSMMISGTPAHAESLGDRRPTGHAGPEAEACAEEDREIIDRAFYAWHRGTASITDVFAPDIVWRIEGRSAISKVYRSKKEFVDEVMTPFVARFDKSRDPFRPTEVHSIFCAGDTMIVYWDGYGIANNGYRYKNSYAWFMKMHQGKVIRGTAFYDSIAFNELWSRVKPSSS